MEKAVSRAATRTALASMLLLWVAEQVVAERNSLESGSLKVGVERGVGTASFQAPCFVYTILEDVAVVMGPNYDCMCQ